LQVGDTGPVESARRSNSRVLGSPFSGLSGHRLYLQSTNFYKHLPLSFFADQYLQMTFCFGVFIVN
jgi:hypothetical protein